LSETRLVADALVDHTRAVGPSDPTLRYVCPRNGAPPDVLDRLQVQDWKQEPDAEMLADALEKAAQVRS